MRKRLAALLLTAMLCSLLCGFALFEPKVVIDTEKNPVYAHVTADLFLKSIEISKDAAEGKYDKQYLLLSGSFGKHNAEDKEFTILNQDGKAVICEYGKSFKGNFANFQAKDRVAVYGKCSVLFGKFTITDVKKIITAPNVKSAEQYFTLDGNTLDRSTATERTLHDGTVKFYIPSAWKSVEKNIQDEKLGSIEGYQYVLNRLSDGRKEEPESLFVCYFDKELLKNPDDIKKTKDVEKQIAMNIEGKVDRFPSRSESTSYGAEYNYYLGKFTDAMDVGKGYHTEYVFQEDGSRGIILYLYLYRDAVHISDVMLLTRLLEVH